MNYDWGKNADLSLVYQILTENEQVLPRDNIPYAELWMGAHPKGSSRTMDGKALSELDDCAIPFLFKVLSIQKPLSIQVHPNREISSLLHARDPANYPDGNHKPEMCYFLRKSKMLYGIRPYAEIIAFFEKIDELRALIEPENLRAFVAEPTPAHFRSILSDVFHSDRKRLEQLINSFLQNFEKYEISGDIIEVILFIHLYFPNDVGMFLPFLTNVVEGEPGSSLFIPAGVLHSYLYGDLLEAMALSDNVIRAAMTSKYIDVDLLLNVVNPEPTPVHWIEPKILAPNHTVLMPPISYNEFLLHSFYFEENSENEVSDISNESIFLVLDGSGTVNGMDYQRGFVILTMKNQKINICAKTKTHIMFCTHSISS